MSIYFSVCVGIFLRFRTCFALWRCSHRFVNIHYICVLFCLLTLFLFLCYFFHFLFRSFSFSFFFMNATHFEDICIKLVKVSLVKVLITLFALYCLWVFEMPAVAILIRHANDLGGMALWHGMAWMGKWQLVAAGFCMHVAVNTVNAAAAFSSVQQLLTQQLSSNLSF